ncbi:MAG: MFS transporter [Bacteroidota bacterium]
MRQLLKEYLKIDRSVTSLIIAEFFLQLINSAFLAILPLYMRAEGYADGAVAASTKYRYLGVLALAIFIGVYIKGRKLKNLFYLSCICVPLFALGILYTVHIHADMANHIMQLCWGASFTFMQIPVLPFILRNSPREQHTAAISLSYATWSFATIASSIIITVLNQLDPVLFNEATILYIIVGSGFLSIYFIYRMDSAEHTSEYQKQHSGFGNYDWGAISKALMPTLFLAVGAGFTIPFISLFFANVHGLSTSQFASINLVASILVATGSMMVPNIKKNMGYRLAIPATQSFAILALVLMASTQYYSELSIAVYIAIICFLLRQPLMNMAGPMTSEVVMNYVGRRNQEIVSALTSAIWNGSWFFSGMIFEFLRNKQVPYVNIFLITAALYTIGVFWYHLLVKEYVRKENSDGLK